MLSAHQLLRLCLGVCLIFSKAFAEEETCSAKESCGARAPNVFIWGHPRTGSSVFLNALASSGYWGGNIHMEPYNIMGIFEPLDVPSSTFGFESYPTSFTAMMEEIKTRGPFVIKEFPYTLLRSGYLNRQTFLKDPSFKHIFLLRDPKDSIKSMVIGAIKHNWYANKDTVPGWRAMNIGTFGADVDHYASGVRKAAGIEEAYLQYRYMTEVLGLEDNILVMDITEVWADPEGAMRHTAEFLGVEWTESFLKWEGAQFYMPELIVGWIEAVSKSNGFFKREDVAEGATKTSELGILPLEMVQAMLDEIEFQTVPYKWLQEHVPAHHRLRKTSA
eukprot:m.52936 g.52936  ORF g.52936 m.52936 type:complete len:332 (+) comp48517_c0_seq1:116-1111(+)